MTSTIERIRHAAILGLLVATTACVPHPHDETRPDAGHVVPDSARDSSPDAALPPQGLIALSENQDVGAPPRSWVDASFMAGSPLGTPIASDGPCTAYVANYGNRSAGVIAVTGTTVPIMLIPGAAYGPSPIPPSDLFSPHAIVHVAAAGGPDFVAFAGDVTTPADLIATPPSTMSRQGHVLTWTADTATAILIAVNTSSVMMICRVPDNGSYEIPASSFALLPNATDVEVELARTQETVIETASGVVTLWAMTVVGRYSVALTP